jgi:hypothetical protein
MTLLGLMGCKGMRRDGAAGDDVAVDDELAMLDE